MSTVRNQILGAIVTALEAASAGGTTKPTALAVHRMKQTPIEDDALPALVVYPQENEPDVQAHIDHNLNHLSVRVECRARITEGDAPDETIEPLLLWVQKALKADETFGGLAMQIVEGMIQWDEELMEAGFAAAAFDWTVEFFTQESDPEAQ